MSGETPGPGVGPGPAGSAGGGPDGPSGIDPAPSAGGGPAGPTGTDRGASTGANPAGPTGATPGGRALEQLPFLASGIAQIAWIVEDLEDTVRAYHDRFGIGPWHFYTYGPPLVKKASYRGRPSSYRMRVALSYFGPMRVEFIQPLEGPSIYDEHVEAHGYGIHHLGVLVDDMETALAAASRAGYAMIQDGSGFGPDGDGHYAYIDTEREFGVVYELIQRPARRHPPEKVYPSD